MAKAPKNTAPVLDVLKRCARDMRTIDYGDLAQEVGLPDARSIRYPLGHIRDKICRAHNRPWLVALAVNAQTRRPSGSFLPEGVDLSDDDEHWWRGMVMQVYAYDWSGVTLDE